MGGTLRLSSKDASALLAEIAEREAAAYQRGLQEMRQEIERLKSAITQIWKADVYEGRKMSNGISLHMVTAVRAAAAAAGLIKEKPE